MIGIKGFVLCPVCLCDLEGIAARLGNCMATRCSQCDSQVLYRADSGELVKLNSPRRYASREAPGRQTPRIRHKGNWNLP